MFAGQPVSAGSVGQDVHVRIWLSGRCFDFAIAAAGVANLLSDWKRQRWCHIELISTPVDAPRLPRLPCERLYCLEAGRERD